MELQDIKSHDDILAIYKEQNLTSVAEKAKYLAGVMKILATRCDIEDSPEDELASLEELALSHLWEGLR